MRRSYVTYFLISLVVCVVFGNDISILDLKRSLSLSTGKWMSVHFRHQLMTWFKERKSEIIMNSCIFSCLEIVTWVFKTIWLSKQFLCTYFPSRRIFLIGTVRHNPSLSVSSIRQVQVFPAGYVKNGQMDGYPHLRKGVSPQFGALSQLSKQELSGYSSGTHDLWQIPENSPVTTCLYYTSCFDFSRHFLGI